MRLKLKTGSIILTKGIKIGKGYNLDYNLFLLLGFNNIIDNNDIKPYCGIPIYITESGNMGIISYNISDIDLSDIITVISNKIEVDVNNCDINCIKSKLKYKYENNSIQDISDSEFLSYLLDDSLKKNNIKYIDYILSTDCDFKIINYMREKIYNIDSKELQKIYNTDKVKISIIKSIIIRKYNSLIN